MGLGSSLLDHCLLSSEVGETPLHKAAQTSSVGVVKLLIDEGADVNPKTDTKVREWLMCGRDDFGCQLC